MFDPWDVKSTINPGQYVSCIKINGVPLLPPVLSRECKKEMQYYKALAVEAERRINLLRPLVDDTEAEEQDAPKTPDQESVEIPPDEVEAGFNINIDKITAINTDKTVTNEPTIDVLHSPKVVIDLSLSINELGKNSLESATHQTSDDKPERDNSKTDDIQFEMEINAPRKQNDIFNFSFNINEKIFQNGLLSAKSFTGSLNDISTESSKSHNNKLVRQRSYTLLNPSPQLLAHLEVQSISTGVDVNSISMSESSSKLSISPNKKRRSWDLEQAKNNWSSMAVEIKKNGGKNLTTLSKITRRSFTPRARSVDKKADDKSPKNVQKRATSPSLNQTKEAKKSPIPDPAMQVKSLYEKVKSQQTAQMAILIERQKKEQLLLQQIFEEQNSMLRKQLKTICPEEKEVKQAWGEKEQGPVSLSQLINSPQSDSFPSTLTQMKNYINHCNDVLKKSHNITDSLKKTNLEGSKTRTHSPVRTPRRKIVYDTSSSDRDVEPMSTARTNDTLADLNTTFSTDEGDVCEPVCNETVINNCLNRIRPNMAVCPSEREVAAATKIVAYAKGYLTRRLMQTDRVQGTVQTIRDAILCAIQLHQDNGGIKGPDIDLHRRLLQQITAACYSLHDTLVSSSAAQRCCIIAADRAKLQAKALRQSPSPRVAYSRNTSVMSQSVSGVFPPRPHRSSLPIAMTQSHHETYSSKEKALSRRSSMQLPRKKPWR